MGCVACLEEVKEEGVVQEEEETEEEPLSFHIYI